MKYDEVEDVASKDSLRYGESHKTVVYAGKGQNIDAHILLGRYFENLLAYQISQCKSKGEKQRP